MSMCAVIFYTEKNPSKLSWELLKKLNKHNKVFLVKEELLNEEIKKVFQNEKKFSFYKFDGRRLKDVEIL
jgi:flagellar biosynthesis/type III secretory pathway chaperone